MCIYGIVLETKARFKSLTRAHYTATIIYYYILVYYVTLYSS